MSACDLQTACWWVMRPIKEVRQQGQTRRALTPDSRSASFLRQTRKQHFSLRLLYWDTRFSHSSLSSKGAYFTELHCVTSQSDRNTVPAVSNSTQWDMFGCHSGVNKYSRVLAYGTVQICKVTEISEELLHPSSGKSNSEKGNSPHSYTPEERTRAKCG